MLFRQSGEFKNNKDNVCVLFGKIQDSLPKCHFWCWIWALICTDPGIYPSSSTNINFLTKIEFSDVLFQKKKKKSPNYCKMQMGVRIWCKFCSRFMVEPWSGSRWCEAPENVWSFCVRRANGEVKEKPSNLNCFEYKFDANIFLNVVKQNFMKIEFENSIKILSFLYHLPDIKFASINPWDLFYNLEIIGFKAYNISACTAIPFIHLVGYFEKIPIT